LALDFLATTNHSVPFFALKRFIEGTVYLYLHKDMQTVPTSNLVPSQGKDILHVTVKKYKSKPATASIEHLARYA
jgi:hypothetical protein